MLKLNAYDRTTSTDGWLWTCCADKSLGCLQWLVISENGHYPIWHLNTLHNLKWWSALNPEDMMLAGLMFGRICLSTVVTYYLLNSRNRLFDKISIGKTGNHTDSQWFVILYMRTLRMSSFSSFFSAKLLYIYSFRYNCPYKHCCSFFLVISIETTRICIIDHMLYFNFYFKLLKCIQTNRKSFYRIIPRSLTFYKMKYNIKSKRRRYFKILP